MNHLSEGLKTLGDIVAGVGTITGLMWILKILATVIPVLAALASLTWYVIRIHEWYKGKKNGNIRLDQLDS